MRELSLPKVMDEMPGRIGNPNSNPNQNFSPSRRLNHHSTNCQYCCSTLIKSSARFFKELIGIYLLINYLLILSPLLSSTLEEVRFWCQD
jgi:hypothetical protein